MPYTRLVLPPNFAEDVHQALTLWHKDVDSGSPLERLALVRRIQSAGQVNLRRATNQALLEALDRLEVDHARDAAVLRKRFLDDRPVYAVANELNVAEPTLFKMQRQAILRLAETLYSLELAAKVERASTFERRLPPATYTQLVGVETHLGHLSRVLTDSHLPMLVAVEGMGGLGKTALAHGQRCVGV